MHSLKKTPKALGYSLPPEWHPHSATQLHWPSNPETWPGERLQRVEKVYLNIIEVLHCFEPIHLLVEDQHVKERVCNLFEKRGISAEPITIHVQAINDVWARDCGPLFIRRESNRREEFAITDWEYNAWGGKYPPFEADNYLPKFFSSCYNIQRFEPAMVLEGGSIDTNGEGVLLTTEAVLLNSNRNPQLQKYEIEMQLKEYLGVEKIIWLKEGLAGDDTDGHVDDIARFVNKNTILTTVSLDATEVNYAALRANLELLLEATDQNEKEFVIETLPLPQTQIAGTTVDGSQHVPASYTNFYVANGVVLVPTYDERYDQKALDLFELYFPDREVVGIPCNDLVWGQGSIHCITQQLYQIP